MRSIRHIGGLVLAVFALACSEARGQSTRDLVSELEARLPALIEAAEIPGLSIALVDDGEVVWKGAFGVLSATSGEPVDSRTIFEAASLSKPVTAFVAMRFVERGELELDRPLRDYLPNARMEHDDRYRQITPRMVLSHSSGLPNWGGDRLDLEFDPGSGFRYSGEGYVYLQRVLEHIAGRPLADLAGEDVFERLAMGHTSFVWMDAYENRVAFGHDAVGRSHSIRRPREANAAASLLTTAGDYGRLLATVLTRTNLPPDLYDDMLGPIVSARVPWAPAEASEGVEWALGWGVEPDAGILWHWGDNGNFEAFVAGDLRSRRGFVYFANSTHGLSISEEIGRMVFGRKIRGPSWGGYDRYDDPTRTAVRAAFHTFREDGLDAGRRAFRAARIDTGAVVLFDLAQGLARLLGNAELVDAAVAVLEEAVEEMPEPGDLQRDLAEAYHRAGRFQEAAETFGKLDGDYSSHIAWIELRTAAAPPDIATTDLEGLAGEYGPRRVTMEDGRLIYQRDGNPKYELIPMSDTMFRLDGLETFRIRFEIDESGTASKIIGLYMDGSSDETPRTP